jgi:GNAT superfamily N-acetyltransferase
VSKVEITRVRTPAERDAFIKFPWRVYANDPVWVPPLLLERKQFLDRKKHPFYEHGDAVLFLARSGGEIVGRIMACDDPKYNTLHQSNVGFFGMFESIDDQQVANALLETATDWLRQLGRDQIMGPIDYSIFDLCGVLIEGFQFPPMVLTAYNPPYYRGLIERSGFEKEIDLYAWWFDEPANAAARLRKLAGSLRKRSEKVTVRPANLKDLANEVGHIRSIYNEAWAKNWGYVPFNESEFAYMTKEMKPLLVQDFMWLAEIGGEPVGFILCVPDINVALKKINGRLTTFGMPIGLAKLLYYKSRIKTVRLVAMGVVPKYRRQGASEMLVLQIIEEVMIKRGLVGECSLILENNRMMNRFLEAIGAEKYKTYRIYRRRIEKDASSR